MLVDLNLINLLVHFTLPWFIPWTYRRQERWKVRCAHNVICQALSNTIAHVLTTMPLSHAFASVIQTAFVCGCYWCTWALNWASTSVSPPLPVTDVTDRNQALRSRKTSTNPRRAVSSLGMSCLLIHGVAPVRRALVRFQSGFLVKPNHLERNSFVLYSCFI